MNKGLKYIYKNSSRAFSSSYNSYFIHNGVTYKRSSFSDRYIKLFGGKRRISPGQRIRLGGNRINLNKPKVNI
jgi:hypothetical protein